MEKLKEVYGECTAAARSELAAERRLSILMGNVPGNTRKVIEEATELAVRYERLYGVSRKATMAAEGQLSVYQLHSETIKRLIPALLNYAESEYGITLTADQAIEKTKLLGKAFIGNAGALTRAGIGLTDAQKKIIKTGTEAQKADLIIGKLNNRFGGFLERNAKSGSGKTRIIELRVEGMQAKIGKALLPLKAKFLELEMSLLPLLDIVAAKLVPALVKGVTWITKMVDKATKWAKENPKTAKTLGIVLAVVVGLVALAGPILTVIEVIGTLISTVGAIAAAFQVGGIAAAISTAFAAWPVLLIIAAIGVVAGLAFLIIKNWGKVKAAMQSFWAWIQGASPLAKLLRWIPMVGLTIMIIQHWDKVKAWFKAFKEFFIKLWKDIVDSPSFKNFLKGASVVGDKLKGLNKLAGKGWDFLVTDPTTANRPALPTGRAGLGGSTAHATAANGHVTVELKGAPPGTRAKIRDGSKGINLRMGYNHATAQ